MGRQDPAILPAKNQKDGMETLKFIVWSLEANFQTNFRIMYLQMHRTARGGHLTELVMCNAGDFQETVTDTQ